jgi:hypothetical protein
MKENCTGLKFQKEYDQEENGNTIKLWELPCAAEDQLSIGMDMLCSKEQWYFCEHFWKVNLNHEV